MKEVPTVKYFLACNKIESVTKLVMHVHHFRRHKLDCRPNEKWHSAYKVLVYCGIYDFIQRCTYNT